MTPTIINIVSGKGGTGKTLLSCVLADMLGNTAGNQTVVVDLDFFVRGLTTLLYFHHEEKLQITSEVSVSEYFISKRTHRIENLAILKYRSFDVVPAVARINELLKFNDIGPNTKSEARVILEGLISSLGFKYRFIILDSRAGYDELVSVAHTLSNVSICVEEQDPISRITSDNLILQLESESRAPVFRLVNKARDVKSQDDIFRENRSITDLGMIPFDMDIMNSFGSLKFWDVVSGSLYRWALTRSWNILNSKLQLRSELVLPRISPVVSEKLEESLGILPIRERVVFIYGLLLGIVGIGYGILGEGILDLFRNDPTRLASIAAGLTGISLSIYAFFRRQ